jgi:endonuclease III
MTGDIRNIPKEPFDIDEVFRRLRIAVADLPKAAMFDLRDRGFGTPFEQLVGSLISARTRRSWCGCWTAPPSRSRRRAI